MLQTMLRSCTVQCTEGNAAQLQHEVPAGKLDGALAAAAFHIRGFEP
jgi:hypothetical protein